MPFPTSNQRYLNVAYDSLVEKGKLVLTAWACHPEIFHGVIELNEEEYKKKELLPKHQKQWEVQKKPTLNIPLFI